MPALLQRLLAMEETRPLPLSVAGVLPFGRLTEDDDVRVLESGEERITEDG